MASGSGSSYLGKSIFDPNRWLAEFRSSKNFKQQRMEIMQQTLEACKNFKYSLVDGTEISFADHQSVSREVRKTVLHKEEILCNPTEFEKGANLRDQWKTEIIVVNADCLEEAIRLKHEGYNPAVLNMASSRRPGQCSKCM